MTEHESDEQKYPQRYAMADGGFRYQNTEEAQDYLNDWINKFWPLSPNVATDTTDSVNWTTRAENREERVVDPATGGEKGRKIREPAFIDPVALQELGDVAGHGARKYDKYNYLRGYEWSLSANALQRHFLAFWSGEDFDPETGEQHMAHAAWHALALVSFVARGIGTDDRPPVEEV